MACAPEADVTAMLRAWTGGDRDALNRLITVLYQELKRIAQGYMGRERAEHTLHHAGLAQPVQRPGSGELDTPAPRRSPHA